MTRRVAICLVMTAGTVAQTVVRLDSTERLKAHNVAVTAAEYKGRKAVRVTEKSATPAAGEDRLAILTGLDFQDGVIEIEVSGRPGSGASEGARGFVGVAFRTAADVSKFECFYLRPTNGRADDQVRRNHSTQYISFPDFPWHKLRKEEPEKYESYADLVPGEWTMVKIEVRGRKARLYVHGAEQPCLIVSDLKLGETQGAIGLWIGPGTEAHFANLRLSP